MRDERPLWRFSVEEILHERQQRGFSDLEALVAFLRAEMSGDEGDPGDKRAS